MIKHVRYTAAAALALTLLGGTAACGPKTPPPGGGPAVTSVAPKAPARAALSTAPVAAIPVLAWHQVIAGTPTTAAQDVYWDYGKDCAPTAPVCDAAANDETVSATQLSTELAWLRDQGYHSVTAAQYQGWVAGRHVALPSRPILLTFDDGTLNMFVGVTQILQRYGFTAVAFIVSEFANGASANKEPYVGWDATWAQLEALPATQWSFGFHAGAQGHGVTYPDNPGCTYFYPCQLPGESDAAYRQRVTQDIDQGRADEEQQLGSRMNTAMWAVPWNDLAQPGHPTSGHDPAAWLSGWAADQFPIIFLQDPSRNGVQHERYRLEVQGTWSQADFTANLADNLGNGFFNLDT